MRQDIAIIVHALISNIGISSGGLTRGEYRQIMASQRENVVDGIGEIQSSYPNITKDEREELETVKNVLKKTYR